MKRALLIASVMGLQAGTAWSQEIPRHLSGFQRAHEGSKVHLTFLTDLPVASTVFYASKPERLIVEFPDTDYTPGYAAPGGSGKGLTFVHWHRAGLGRLRCELGLPCRLPMSALHMQASGNELDVTLDLSYSLRDTYQVTAGIDWVQEQSASDGRFLYWNQLSYAVSDPNVQLTAGLAKDRTDGLERPSATGARLGAVGGVNGGFFTGEGGPVGLVVQARHLRVPPSDRRPPRTALEVHLDRTVTFDRLSWKKDHLETTEGEPRTDIESALGGGPRLVRDGRPALDTDAEELGPKGNDITRVAARTAVGLTRDGKVQVVAATGEHDLHREGLTLDDLAAQMQARGAYQAMNLDGGSSTSMFVGTRVVSNGPDAPALEKQVGDSLLLIDHRPQLFPGSLSLTLGGPQMVGDGKATLPLTVQVTTPDGHPVADGTPVRAYPVGVWLDSQVQSTKGGVARFTVTSLTRVGPASIRVESGSTVASSELRLVPGDPGELFTRLTVVPPLPGATDQTVLVSCQVNDKVGNPVPATSVTVAGAPTGDASALTGIDGLASLTVHMPLTGGTVEVRAPGLPVRRLQVAPVAAPPAPATPGPEATPTPPVPTSVPVP